MFSLTHRGSNVHLRARSIGTGVGGSSGEGQPCYALGWVFKGSTSQQHSSSTHRASRFYLISFSSHCLTGTHVTVIAANPYAVVFLLSTKHYSKLILSSQQPHDNPLRRKRRQSCRTSLKSHN